MFLQRTKGFLKLSLLAVPVVLASFVSVPAQAQEDDLKIAIVDVQVLLTESKAAESIQKQVEKEAKTFQGKVQALEKEASAKEQTLSDMVEKKTTKEEFEAKRNTFQKELLQSQQELKKEQVAVQRAASEAMNRLRMEIIQVVSDIADENGYDIVMSKDNIIIAGKALNITDEVKKKLDDKIKTIKIDVKGQ